MTPIASSINQPELTFAQRDKIIGGAVSDVSHIATLPEITVKIIELVENPNSTAQDLHLIISNDPALSARVLKVVNSAFYALPGQVGSINRAIVLLGLNAVKNIAIAASLAKLFRGGRLCPSFSARDLWQHSIAVAAATKLLAERTGMATPEEAFLSGLMHDIGIMVEMQVRRPKLLQVFDRMQTQNESFRQAEIKVFSVTHENFGQALCERWKFPGFLAYTAGYHHRPNEVGGEHRPLVMMSNVADIMAARSGIGYAGTVDRPEYRETVLDELKLTAPMIDEIQGQLPAAAQVADSLLN